MALHELLALEIKRWTEEVGLLETGDPEKQFFKILEEVKEARWAYRDDFPERVDTVEDEIGDILFATHVLAYMLNREPIDCLERAIEKNKERKWYTFQGTAVRDK